MLQRQEFREKIVRVFIQEAVGTRRIKDAPISAKLNEKNERDPSPVLHQDSSISHSKKGECQKSILAQIRKSIWDFLHPKENFYHTRLHSKCPISYYRLRISSDTGGFLSSLIFIRTWTCLHPEFATKQRPRWHGSGIRSACQ